MRNIWAVNTSIGISVGGDDGGLLCVDVLDGSDHTSILIGRERQDRMIDGWLSTESLNLDVIH